MTTKVTVDAHAGWPVRVTQKSLPSGTAADREVIVPPGTVQDFYVHSNMEIEVTELARDEAASQSRTTQG